MRGSTLQVTHVLSACRKHWGVDGQEAIPLPGERDTNFLVTDADGDRWVLKVAPEGEPTTAVLLETAALEWLVEAGADLPIPRIRPTLGGTAMAEMVDEAGRTHRARLLQHLPGRLLAEVRPHTPELLEDLGRTLGRVDEALEGFVPPAPRTADFEWDLSNAGGVMRDGLGLLRGERRAQLEAVLELFQSEVEPFLPSLPLAVVHGDANDYNVLVEEPEPTDPRPPHRVTGLIDFGDLLETPRVCEPAIAGAYALLAKADPLRAVAWVLRGYHDVRPLREEELDVLWPLVLARLGVSVAISARRGSEHPADSYLRISEGPAWDALPRASLIHPRLARSVLREAVGWAPSRSGVALSRWLEDRKDRRAAVLPPDVMEKPRALDLGVGSLELPSLDATWDAETFQDHLFRLLEDEGATVGVGRYGEPRLLYRGDAFRHPSGDPLLARTVHLGIDLFAPARTAVCAPLAARVHAVADNRGPRDYGPTVILEHSPSDGPTFWTLYGHLARASLAALTPGQRLEVGESFAHLGTRLENGGWPAHLHFQIIADLLDREGEFPGVAPPDERKAWMSLSPDPALLLELPAGSGAPAESTVEELVGRRHGLLGRNLSVSYRKPLHIVRGWRQHLYDPEGRPYLDCVNNVAHVGHAHPRVVEAAARQKRVLETNTRYLHELLIAYAQRLASTLPPPLGVCWLVSSGSEANELALRMARAATGREDVVVLESAYHGNTTTLIDLSPYKHGGPGGRGAPPWVQVALLPDDYRGPYRRDDPTRGRLYASHLGEAVEAAQRRAGGPAAFLHESFPSCAGQIELPPGYLSETYRLVRQAGGVVIADEVQVGLGRVGSHFWGFETQGVVPDIVTLGKPLGNGHPLGAVVATPEVAHAFEGGMEYFSTFGGNPASCAVGLAVLEVLEEEGLQAHAARVGERMLEGLRSLAANHPVVGDVRGRGLFLGVELVREADAPTPDPEVADYLIQRARERGVLLSTDGPAHNVIKIKPPMPFGEEDADRLVALVDEILGEDFVRRRS